MFREYIFWASRFVTDAMKMTVQLDDTGSYCNTTEFRKPKVKDHLLLFYYDATM